MIHDVALIGIGIVGQVALEELSSSGLKIVVIDQIHTTPESHFLRDIDGDKSVWTIGSRVAGFPGGRLNWGKNCSFATIEGHPPLGNELQSRLPELNRRLRKYGFPKLHHVELRKLRDDKFYVRESAEFSPSYWISKVESIGNIKLISGFATKIVEDPNGHIKILARNSNHQVQEIYVKKVIICAGPFGTQELLANSELLPEITPRIWDHISLSLPNISLGKIGLTKFGMFGWNRLKRINKKRCSTFYDGANAILWTLRIFPEGVLNLNMALTQLKRELRNGKLVFCMSLLCKLGVSMFTGKFLYQEIKIHITADFLDQSNSMKSASYGEGRRIDFLEYPDKSIPVSKELEEFISRTISKLNLDFDGESHLTIGEKVELAEVTSSSHHMGTVWKVHENSIKSPLEISKNVFAAGSSIFQASVPGHPTMLAAASALVVADLVKSQLA